MISCFYLFCNFVNVKNNKLEIDKSFELKRFYKFGTFKYQKSYDLNWNNRSSVLFYIIPPPLPNKVKNEKGGICIRLSKAFFFFFHHSSIVHTLWKLELPWLLSPNLPSNRPLLRNLDCTHFNYQSHECLILLFIYHYPPIRIG